MYMVKSDLFVSWQCLHNSDEAAAVASPMPMTLFLSWARMYARCTCDRRLWLPVRPSVLGFLDMETVGEEWKVEQSVQLAPLPRCTAHSLATSCPRDVQRV